MITSSRPPREARDAADGKRGRGLVPRSLRPQARLDGLQLAFRSPHVWTQAARKATLAGGSLRDVQDMLGHASLNTAQRHLEPSRDAKRRLVDLV
jgi:site-specific recombinase XerD